MSLQNDELLASQAIELGAYEEAVRLLRPLAEQNSHYALLTLGWIYESGATGPADNEVARSFYDHAGSQGSATAYLYLGRLLQRSGDETGAMAAFQRGAQLGDDESKAELARLATSVDDKLARQALADQDYDEAVPLLLSLAERDSKFALLVLGYISETGVTGAPDWETAGSYYERAAAQGSATGYFELGRLLERQGEEAQARLAFQAGAELSHLPSMSRLGTMLIEGLGGPTDVEAGTAWIAKAAAHGHIFARRKLLGAEARQTKSPFRKAVVAVKILALGIEGAREKSRDPNSDKVR